MHTLDLESRPDGGAILFTDAISCVSPRPETRRGVRYSVVTRCRVLKLGSLDDDRWSQRAADTTPHGHLVPKTRD